VGIYWTEDGVPDPEAVVLEDRLAARLWVIEGAGHMGLSEVVENQWMCVATYRRHDEESYAIAALAKVIA
jgi:hypothetical protein